MKRKKWSCAPEHLSDKISMLANRKAGNSVPPETEEWNESPCVFLASLVIISPFEMKASVH